jgi:voltage-gated potassium channel
MSDDTTPQAGGFWVRPLPGDRTAPPPTDSRLGIALRRFLNLLSTFNNLLLAPMFTLMVIELINEDSARNLAQSEWFMVRFCGLFFAEWALGFALAHSKTAYLKNFWLLADLFSSIPFSWVFQTGRVMRFVRLTRLLRLGRYRKFSRLVRLARISRMKMDVGRIVRAVGVVLSLALSGALALRVAEPETVTGTLEAMYWAVVTITAVGYGDITPVSPVGRLVGMALILASLGVFGYAAALASSAMEAPDRLDRQDRVLTAIKETEARLNARLDRLEAVARDAAPTGETDGQV